ncbi:MAG: hypothetical protein IPK13_07175 [Deltaproteobacteria bacterium]|nr:hypothetical protein [Deltaproteobacteria bacterium]
MRAGTMLGVVTLGCVLGCGRDDGAGLDGTPIDEHHAALMGDWFECVDATCQSLAQAGMRYLGDGRWVALEADPLFLEPDETYCVFERSQRAYSTDGTHLVVQGRFNDQFLTWTISPSEDGESMSLWIGPDAVSVDQGPRQVEFWRRVDRAQRSYGCL